jgi:flagellin
MAIAIDPYNAVATTAYSTGTNPVNESIASGSRINRAADDAAGMAIVSALNVQLNAQDMASRNANDGIALLQTADAARQGIGANLLRMGELAIQAQNGTLNNEQRGALNQEFQQNLQNINRLAETTRFNDIPLLNTDNNTLNIALADSNVTLDLPNLTTDNLGLTDLNLSSVGSAALATQGLGLATEQLSSAASRFGAQQNGLASAAESLQNQNISTLQTRSQISDTDMARAITEQIRQSVLTESSVAMQAQSNQSRGSVLQLLNS